MFHSDGSLVYNNFVVLCPKLILQIFNNVRIALFHVYKNKTTIDNLAIHVEKSFDYEKRTEQKMQLNPRSINYCIP